MWVALAMFGALVGLLAVPFDIRFTIAGAGPFRTDVDVRWLFGRVRLPSEGASADTEGTEPFDGSELDGQRPSTGRFRPLAMARSPGFLRRLARFLSDMLRCAEVRTLRLAARIGLDDPADTGVLWGYLAPLSVVAAGVPVVDLRLAPDFQRERLELDGAGDLRIVPLRVVSTLAGFALSPVTLRAVRAGLR